MEKTFEAQARTSRTLRQVNALIAKLDKLLAVSETELLAKLAELKTKTK